MAGHGIEHVVESVFQRQPRDTLEVWARKEVVQILRSRPDFIRFVGLQDKAGDLEFLDTVAGQECPFTTLRAAGFGLAPAARVAELLPYAVEAPKGRDPLCQCFYWRYYALACLSVFAAACLVFAAVWVRVRATAGWDQEGRCNLKMFSNRTCQQGTGCAFEVRVKPSGVNQLYFINRWQIPRKVNYGTGGIIFDGEPFRCCDMEDRLDCCSFEDRSKGSFCDMWPHRRDPAGEPCPSSSWPCLILLDDGGGVKDIKPYDPPLVWPYALAGGLLLLAPACAALAVLYVWPWWAARRRRLSSALPGPAADTHDGMLFGKALGEARGSLPLALEATRQSSKSTRASKGSCKSPANREALEKQLAAARKPSKQSHHSRNSRRSKAAAGAEDDDENEDDAGRRLALRQGDLSRYALHPTLGAASRPIITPLPTRRPPPGLAAPVLQPPPINEGDLQVLDLSWPCGVPGDAAGRRDRAQHPSLRAAAHPRR